MAGKTAYEAVKNYVDPLRRAISCICDAGALRVEGYRPRDEPHRLILGDGVPHKLKDGKAITVGQRYQIVQSADPDRGPWKVSITGYSYALDDQEGLEIVAYHWHPPTGPARPHLHVGAGSVAPNSPVEKAHLPTNRVSLEDFLRLLLTDLGVPQRRDDWPEILEGTQGLFETWQTWPRPGQPPH